MGWIDGKMSLHGRGAPGAGGVEGHQGQGGDAGTGVDTITNVALLPSPC